MPAPLLHPAAAAGVAGLLTSSEIEPYTLGELLELADEDSLALWEGMSLGYPSSQGHELLRAEIAALYETAAAPDVLVCAGADRAIAAAVGALVRPRDRVVLVEPVYGPLLATARAVGADVRLVTLAAEEDWRFDLSRFDEALGPRPRLAILNFPHNPTGSIPSAEVFTAAVRLVESRGGYVLSDEVYRSLEHDPRDRLPSALDLSDRALAIGVMSKAFAAPGLRIGWLAGRNRTLLARAAICRDRSGASTAAPSEILALAVLRAGDEVLARSGCIVARNLRAVEGFLARHRNVLECVAPRAGSVCYPLLHSSFSVERLAADLLARERFSLLTGAFFGSASNHFRLGLGRLDLPVALEALERTLP